MMVTPSMPLSILLLLAALSAFIGIAEAQQSQSLQCTSNAFAHLLGKQTLPGADVVDVQVNELHDYKSVSLPTTNFPTVHVTACEVKLSYENPAANSTRVTITTWLPLTRDAWNGRLMGTGGGGFLCSMGPGALNAPISGGFAATTTDAGLSGKTFFEPNYALLSIGNPDTFKLERLGHRAIHDMTVAAKKIIQLYYGTQPSKSYYAGCSTGGRQGLMEASAYPGDYDGLLVGAPAANMNTFIPRVLAEGAWMWKNNYFPTPCELAVIQKAAIARCDALDGRIDGMIARQDLCKFTAQSVVGHPYVDTCDGSGEEKRVTDKAARLYQHIVDGSLTTKHGRKVSGSGFPWGTNVTFPFGVGSTMIDAQSGKRVPMFMPFATHFVEEYLLYGLERIFDKAYTLEQVAEWQEKAQRLYEGILEPHDDLRAFRERGGKIIWWHGEEDSIIPLANSLIKLDKIRAATYAGVPYDTAVEKMQDFVRFYVVTGLAHCRPLIGREGKVPMVGARALMQLVRWVEQGEAPDDLLTDNTLPTERGLERLCRWPSQPRWTDDGTTMTCVARATSLIGRLPRLLDAPIRFMELLPKMLFLRINKLPDEL